MFCRKYITIGLGVLIVLAGAVYFRQMMNPVPFLSREDRLGHGDYVVLARKLHDFDVRLSGKFKTRADLIEALVASKVYSREEIDRLADPDCRDTNLLFDDGIVFWKFRRNCVSYVSPAWGAYLESKSSFDSRLKPRKNQP